MARVNNILGHPVYIVRFDWHLKNRVIQVHRDMLYLIEKMAWNTLFFSYVRLYLWTTCVPGNMTLNVNGIIRIFSFLDFLPMGHKAILNQQDNSCNN